jgi:hypothetical protein
MFRPNLAIFRCYKQSVENTKSVLKTSIGRTKDGKKSDNEVAMCDRMQMYNTVQTSLRCMSVFTRGFPVI